ncbi:MAG: hypothetical protein ACFIN2_00490 [Candidatus Walczuchella monophlebidarum]
MIQAYRSRGHILTKTNPIRSRREYSPNLYIEQFVLGIEDLETVFEAGKLVGKEPCTLANITAGHLKTVYCEFYGKEYYSKVFSGDVKYHFVATIKRNNRHGKSIKISLAPSHLETVDTVVEGFGFARAKIDHYYHQNSNHLLPIHFWTIPNYEMSQLEGYKTGGTIHIVVNNQMVFTTDYIDGRSSIYCTDIVKVTQYYTSMLMM